MLPEQYLDQAYEDHPFPIAEKQTISQPYIVAIMLQALAVAPTDRVLEVGTGSGYVTALLAELAARSRFHRASPVTVRSMREILLARMRYRNVRIIIGDGSRGFLEAAPYNAIIVSAAAPELPHGLVQQLAEGGRMIVPVGRDDSQQLQFIEMRTWQSQITPRELCRFVPLMAEDGRPSSQS